MRLYKNIDLENQLFRMDMEEYSCDNQSILFYHHRYAEIPDRLDQWLFAVQ
jgi:hypothetical protein